MSPSDLPALNAILNATATVLMTCGFIAIKNKKVAIHRACMISTFVVSCAFLVGYVAHWVLQGDTHFVGQGSIRYVYFGMLISHVILAVVIVPLVITTLILAIRGKFERHRKWARITFPLWYYVSVTGVLVYLFLYQWYPATPGSPHT